jgi:hypothetical protein
MAGRPEQLTPKGLFGEAVGLLVFAGGALLLQLLLENGPRLPWLAETSLEVMEFAFFLFTLGYLLRGLGYLWDQFSYLVEKVAASPTWPRLRSVLLRLLGWAIRGAELIVWAVLCLAVLSAAASLLPRPTGAAYAVVPVARPIPLSALAAVFAAPALAALLVRTVSCVVQARWRDVLSG